MSQTCPKCGKVYYGTSGGLYWCPDPKCLAEIRKLPYGKVSPVPAIK